MKTKIVYISGGEIFNMNDIQNALNQVRSALDLPVDTVLFGVPVDATDALATQSVPSIAVTINSEPVIQNTHDNYDIEPIIEPVTISDSTAEPECKVTPVKKSRGRPKTEKKVSDDVSIPESEPTPVIATEPTKVSSILSVLKSDPTTDNFEISEEIAEPIQETEPLIETSIDIIESTISESTMVDNADTHSDQDIESMIAEDAPVIPQEKTLEQLLESMKPLREDLEQELSADADEETDIYDEMSDTSSDTNASIDTDATLEQLATEFAETQDKIEVVSKPESHGKIGKLKNILPFKKARHDDTGLMGDLFGWAGIAANDEDFAIPGFFTNAASKK